MKAIESVVQVSAIVLPSIYLMSAQFTTHLLTVSWQQTSRHTSRTNETHPCMTMPAVSLTFSSLCFYRFIHTDVRPYWFLVYSRMQSTVMAILKYAWHDF